MRHKLHLMLCALFLIETQAQGVDKKLISTDLHPHIQQLHIKSDIRYRFSTTVITSKMINPEDVARGVIFDVILPNEAFMTNFTLEIEGKVHVGEVKEKEAAKQQFENAKAKGQSAGHISKKQRETNKFNIEVNLAAKGKVIFVLTYQELLKRKRGLYEHVTYINPGQLVPDFQVEVAIQESRNITELNVPEIRKDLLTSLNAVSQETNSIAVIQRPADNEAYILYRPSLEQQKSVAKNGISGQFVVSYDVDRQQNAGEVLLVNGYFVHYFAVDNVQSLPKDVLFLLDVSGSMGGRKIHQLRDAMNNILSDVHPQDRFNIQTFSSSINYWKSNTLIEASPENINKAKQFIDGIRAGGGTNINRAITNGIEMLRSQKTEGREPVMLFLTDGQPTSGVTNRDTILSNIEAENNISVPVCSLAFGRGADYNFVKKLAAKNNCLGRKIYQDSDANLQIEGFYDEISTILLKNINFNYLNGTIDDATITKIHFNTFFRGTEIMVAGRLANHDVKDLGLSVAADSAKGKVSFTDPSLIIPNMDMNLTDNRAIGQITEKLWAYLTIKQLLKERDASTDSKRQDELKKKALKLALKYNFVTKLTSMVVTLPDANKQLEDFLDKPRPIPRPVPRPFPRPWLRKSSSRFRSRARFAPKARFASTGFAQGAGANLGPSLNFASLQSSAPVFDQNAALSSRSSVGLSNSVKRVFKPNRQLPPPPTPPQATGAPFTLTFPPTTTTLPSTTSTTTTASPIQTTNLQLWPIIIKLPGTNDALCFDFQLTPGQTYDLLVHPESGTNVSATISGNGVDKYISQITVLTKGQTLVFLPNNYTIDGTEQQYNSNNYKLNEFNTQIPFKVGVIPQSPENNLTFYIEFPTSSSQLGGKLADYEDISVKSFSGSFISFDIELQKGTKTYSVNGNDVRSQLLYSGICWVLDAINF